MIPFETLWSLVSDKVRLAMVESNPETVTEGS